MTKTMTEENVKLKKILPFLYKLGYSDENLMLNKGISVGRNTKVFVDYAVYLDNSETIAFALEAKDSNEKLDRYKDQVVSYGLLLSAPYSVACNGKEVVIYETHTGTEAFSGLITNKQIPLILAKESLVQQPRTIGIISDDRRARAEKILLEFTEEENFIRILDTCETIIRDADGKTGQNSFAELSKVLFVKTFSESKQNLIELFAQDDGQGIDAIFTMAKNQSSDIFADDETIDLSNECKSRLANLLKDFSFTTTNIDIKGKAFETFIGNTLTGKLGQFFTPRTIVDFMVDFMPPSRLVDNDKAQIIDPSCGSGGFLIRILEKLLKDIEENEVKNKRGEAQKTLVESQLHGIDIDPNLVRTTKMNMVLHGDGKGGIIRENGLNVIHKTYEEYSKKFHYIYTNPPFGNKDDIKDRKVHYTGIITSGVHKNADSKIYREVLFIEQYKNLLADGGHVAVVLPNGVLNNLTHGYVREFILKNFSIKAVIGLPDKSFKSSGANSHTSIVFMQKRHEHTPEEDGFIFMAIAGEVGFERKTKYAQPVASNDLDSILACYRNYKIQGVSGERVKPLGLKCLALPRKDLTLERFDANYYFSRYMVDVVNPMPLSQLCDVVNTQPPQGDKVYKYVQFSDIATSLSCIVSHREGMLAELPGRAKIQIKSGDVIAAKVFDSERNVAMVPDEYDGDIVSNGFVALRPKRGVPSELIFHLLKLPETQRQIRLLCSGTILPSCREDYFMNLKVPRLDKKNIKDVKDSISKAYNLINQGQQILGDITGNDSTELENN